MTMDRSFLTLNHASRERMQAMANLSEAELQTRVGEHWTVAIVLAHLAFWDRRVMYVLEMSEKTDDVVAPEIDIIVNDLLLPFWAAMPVREAGRIAMETAEALDDRLETYPEDLLEKIYTYNQRWIVRAVHRNLHMDEADAALEKRA